MATQCVAFPGIGKGHVELPKIFEVGNGDAVAELQAELAGEIADEKTTADVLKEIKD